MRIEFLYSQGTSSVREDGLVVSEKLFGVLDGVSTPYSPKYPPKKFNGLTGGEMIVRLIEKLAVSSKNKILRQFVLEINKRIAAKQKGVPVGEFSGAVFAFTLIKEDEVEIVQAGDCFAVIEKKDGEIVVSPNQVRRHDEAMKSEIERIMREVSQEFFGLSPEELPEEDLEQVRNEMWNRFRDTLIEARRQDNNNPQSPRGFGILNGDPRLSEMMWEKRFSLSTISTILLFTDGMIPWKKMNDKEIGECVLTDFQRGGLSRVLISSREAETKIVSHISHAEASAVAITF